MTQTAKRVLLIDDDRDDAATFADALKELSINTTFTHYSDGKEALGQLTQPNIPQPDIIFLDINMPILNGWECLRAIKEIASFANIPIIMYSTSNMHDKGLAPRDVGAAAFMTKPDTYRELRTKLEGLLTDFFC